MAKNKQQIKFEADVSGFKTNIKEAEKSITSLNNQLKLNQSQIKGNKEDTNLLSQRIETLKQKYEEQTKVVENTRKSYEKAVEIFGENSKEADNLKNKLLQAETAQQNIKNEINKTNQQLTAQTDKLLTTSKAWQESGERLKDYGSKIEKVGNKLSIVSGLIGGVAVASLKASIDFESAFAGVTKTVDGTEEQLADLRQGILDMSTELPSSAAEIAAVAESAGQLGIQTDSILDFTKVMIDLGNSTNVSADEASSALAKFANVTKMSADQYQNLGSTIVALGNNYATTEADIISMAQNLASAGTQVGMSQSDIMALATALSSVGLEAQTGGTAFSKALVEMQLAVETNSEDLKNWADVAGMSTKEFAKLFKEDATSALEAFIKGLSECGGETESAIKVLDDMGITETRMRDALLRSANASDTFTSAIELGSKAWNENTALTEEASKRYETTESQLEMLKNEVAKTAIEFGDELAPSLRQIVKDAKPMLNSISNAVKAFANLDEKTKKNIITVGAYLVALGPVVKIGGNVIKTIGSVKTGIGTLTGAIGVLKNGTEGANESSINLANSLKKNFSPTGIAITAVVAGITIAKKILDEATEETKKLADATEENYKKTLEEKQAIEDLRNSIDSGLQTDLDNIERTQNLWEELQKITDENGKIKEGYESRAKVITGELSDALGEEITITDNVIDKYKELQNEIDTLILKKQSEAILEASQEKYNEAITNREQKTQELIDKEEEYNDTLNNRNSVYDTLTDSEKKYYEAMKEGRVAVLSKQELDSIDKVKITNIMNLDNSVNSLKNNVSDLRGIVNDYTKDIEEYEYNLTLSAEGTAESIQKMVDNVGTTYVKNGETVKTSYQEQIQAQQYYLQQAKALNEEAVANNDETEKQKSQSTIDESTKRLETIAQELASQTSIIGENSEDVINGWKELATNSHDIFIQEVSKLPPDMQQKINDIVNGVNEKKSFFETTMQSLAKVGVDALDKNAEFRSKAVQSLNSYLQGMSDEDKRNLLKQAGIENADKVMEGLKQGNLSEENGVSILKGLYNGLNNSSWSSTLFKTASSIAGRLSNIFSIKTSVSSSSLPGHKDGLDYVPYDNYVARLHKGERVLTAEENKEYMTGNLENKVSSNRNIVVQFFPQSMSEQELQRAETYIAKKWGMAL